MEYTELIIGLVGAIGTNLNVITEELVKNFSKADCDTEIIKLTDFIKINVINDSYINTCTSKIKKIRYQK